MHAIVSGVKARIKTKHLMSDGDLAVYCDGEYLFFIQHPNIDKDRFAAEMEKRGKDFNAIHEGYNIMSVPIDLHLIEEE